MKNIANYLDEFIDNDLNECACTRIKKDFMKTHKSRHKDEISNNNYKYKKEKHKKLQYEKP